MLSITSSKLGVSYFSSRLLRNSIRTISSKSPKDPEDPTPTTKKRVTVYPKSKHGKPAATASSSASPASPSAFTSPSSKLPRSKSDDKTPKGPIRTKRYSRKPDETPSVTPKAEVPPKVKPNFISFKDFPKAPDHILSKSSRDLYSSINLKQFIQQQQAQKKETEYVDFAIPDKYLKSKIRDQITEKDRALVAELDKFSKSDDDEEANQTQLKLIKLYYDQDTNTLQPLPEHSLKKTLSGMINMNKSLDDIDDEYLWDLLPRERLFGVPPFEPKFEPNGFKNWELEMIQKDKQAQSLKDEDTKQFRDFEQSLSDSKSFYKKAGSRKKVDRKLVKRYKKLKEEGKIPTDLKKNGATNGNNNETISINDVYDDFL